jgi:hypothetical protein
VIAAGPDGLVHKGGPGLFVQGLIAYGPDGQLLVCPTLAPDVVRRCFEYAESSKVGCTAFLGDECVTMKLDRHLKELHTRYFEPLAKARFWLHISGCQVSCYSFDEAACCAAQQAFCFNFVYKKGAWFNASLAWFPFFPSRALA